jgi:hypothetical protein
MSTLRVLACIPACAACLPFLFASGLPAQRSIKGERPPALLRSFRAATPVINGANWWHSMSLSELEAPFLSEPQRSVNRKVQGSNLCPGASGPPSGPRTDPHVTPLGPPTGGLGHFVGMRRYARHTPLNQTIRGMPRAPSSGFRKRRASSQQPSLVSEVFTCADCSLL